MLTKITILDVPYFWQSGFQDTANISMEGILTFNKHLTFLFIIIISLFFFSVFMIFYCRKVFVEIIYYVASQLLLDNRSIEGEKYFPCIPMNFIFIVFNNLILYYFVEFNNEFNLKFVHLKKLENSVLAEKDFAPGGLLFFSSSPSNGQKSKKHRKVVNKYPEGFLDHYFIFLNRVAKYYRLFVGYDWRSAWQNVLWIALSIPYFMTFWVYSRIWIIKSFWYYGYTPTEDRIVGCYFVLFVFYQIVIYLYNEYYYDEDDEDDKEDVPLPEIFPVVFILSIIIILILLIV